MEPTLTTDPSLAAVLDELTRREPLFHRPEFGTTRADHEAMTDPEFWEVGASGRRYSRDHVLDVLQQRQASPVDDPWETSGFHCRAVGADTYLLTYTLRQGERVTRRLTVWRHDADATGWRAVYHQGTLVQD